MRCTTPVSHRHKRVGLANTSILFVDDEVKREDSMIIDLAEVGCGASTRLSTSCRALKCCPRPRGNMNFTCINK